jgi:hypothetical protein
MDEAVLENPVTGESMRVLESTAQIFKVQYSLRPHGEIAGEHFHPHQEQQISVLSGEMHMRIEGEHRIVRAGETATIPVAARHFFRVLFGLARDGRTDGDGYPPLFWSAALFSEFKDSVQPAPFWLRFSFRTLGPVARILGYRREIEKYLR